MQELSRYGHRQRMRNNYLKNGTTAMEDHQILELFLSLVIPQKDVKPLAYDLINHFGSLEAVFNASAQQLMEINGIGECTAVALSLVNDINCRVNANHNQIITHLDNSQKARDYVKNAIGSSRFEQVIVITLNNDLAILGCHCVSDGTVNCATVQPKKVVECVIKDNASSVIIAHNHPNGDPTPSMADLNFTLEVLGILRKIGVNLNDHIVACAHKALSLNSDSRYMMYFDYKE